MPVPMVSFERVDCSLCNTTLKPLKTKIQCCSVLIYSTCNQIKTLFMFFFMLCTRLSFNVCSSNLFRPGTHCCPAKKNNKHLYDFILIWNLCGDLKANFSIDFILFLCNTTFRPSEREFIVMLLCFSQTREL